MGGYPRKTLPFPRKSMKTGRGVRHTRLLLKDLAFVLRILVSGWRATQPMLNTSMADLEGQTRQLFNFIFGME